MNRNEKIKAIHDIVLSHGRRHMYDTEDMKSIFIDEVITLTLEDGTQRKTGFLFVCDSWNDQQVVFDYVIGDNESNYRCVGSCPVALLSEDSMDLLLEKLNNR